MDDLAFLQSTKRPPYETAEKVVRAVDLFAGCGGLTLGLAESAHRHRLALEVALAIDHDKSAANVFSANFPKARVESLGVEEIFDGELGADPSPTEIDWRFRVGSVSWLHGGPPCQGHSDLNNHTRREDPRNTFYERMARAAEILEPAVVLIENVPTVRNDRGQVVDRASRALVRAGYDVADAVVSFHEIGVPQKRRRHTILAVRGVSLGAHDVLDSLKRIGGRDLQWALADLEGVDSDSPFDVPSRASPTNVERMRYLIDNNKYDLPNDRRPRCHQGVHSYKSMYGRLKWSEPSQTITTGFGSMGQGRYVHPSEARTLTPHEAARLQFFPDWFDFGAGGLETRRGAWARMIGNAVPPKLTMELGRVLLPELVQ